MRAPGARRIRRVVVAGATGYLGRHLVAALAGAGYDVRALVRDPSALGRRGHALAPRADTFVSDVRVADVTDPTTLTGTLAGADAVLSCVGHTGTGGAAAWRAVDGIGNRNLLHEALRAGVDRFLYVSLFGAEHIRDVPMVRAHEAFAATLRTADIRSVVVRPTGFYSDMGAVLRQARSGWMPLIGRGDRRLNPIHGQDLAAACVAALDGGDSEVEIGGPEVFSHREIATLAFEVVHRTPRIVSVPTPVVRATLAVLRPFAPGSVALWHFFVSGAEHDLVAPPYGRKTLRAHFEALAAREP